MKRLIILLILSFATVSYGQGPPDIQPGNVNAFTKVGPAPIFTFRQQLGKTMASTWSVQYSDNFPTGDARTALQYAVDIWRFYVSSTQTIRIQADWVDLKDSKALAEAWPAYLPRNFPNAPQSNTGYPVALAEMLAGQQFNGDSADIIISVNSAQTNWYFGTDGNTPAGKFDFVSVILHEIAHGLGFLPSFDATTYPNGSWGNLSGRDAGYKTIYDSRCIFGTQHNFPAYNLTNTTSYPNPSSSLYSALTSDNVFYDGDATYSFTGSALPKLYAPSTWAGGSSISHLDENRYPPGDLNSLMTVAIDSAEAIHSPGIMTLCMLKDLGWSVQRVVIFNRPAGSVVFQQGTTDTVKWSDIATGAMSIDLESKNLDGSYSYYQSVFAGISYVGNANKAAITIASNTPTGQYRLRAYNSGTNYGVSEDFSISNLPQVAAPVFDPPQGSYLTAQQVTITCATAGADIYYTDDGSVPTTSSTRYTGSITVASNKTLIARAFHGSDHNPSQIVSATYLIGPQLQQPSVSPASGRYLAPLAVTATWPAGTECWYNWTNNGTDPPAPRDDYAMTQVPSGLNGKPCFTCEATGYTFKLAFATRYNGRWSTATFVTYIMVPGVRIHQMDESNAPFGQWARWETNQWRFYPDTTLPRPSADTTWRLLASQSFKPGTPQKYNVWAIGGQNYLLNHGLMPLGTGTSEARANYKSAVNATLQSQLLEGGSPGGTLYFLDPWRIDTTDTYGKRNQGMSDWTRPVAYAQNNIGISSPDSGVFIGQIPDPQNPNTPYYRVSAPQVQTNISGYGGVFQNWSATGAHFQNSSSPQTAVVFDNAGATVTANYKGVHVSNDGSAFSNNGERKVVRTYEGWYHMVYTSMGHVWLEESSDGGSTWFLSSFGMPLDKGGGSSPSIDQYPLPSDGHSIIIVAFQEGSNIHVRSFNWDTYGRNFYIDGPQELIPFSGNSPAIAWSTSGLFMVVWKSSSGIAYMPCFLSGYTIGYDQAHQGKISGTDQNSSNPVISSDPYSGEQYFDVAWQQLKPPPPGPPLISIQSCMLYPSGAGYGGPIAQYPQSPVTVSSSSMTQNTYESIVSLPDGPRICWIADYSGTYGGQPTQMKTAMSNPWSSPRTYYTYGFCSRTTSINKRDDDGRFYFAWNEAIPPPIDPQWTYCNYAVGSANLSQTKVIGIGSKWDVQLCNGPSSSNMFVTGFNTTVSPYSFQQSEKLSVDGLAKTSPISMTNMRGVVVENGGAGLLYSFGDLSVDGNPVSFVQIKDDPGKIQSDSLRKGHRMTNEADAEDIAVDSVNTFLVSASFKMGSNSKILFSDYSVVGDSLAAVSLLGDNIYVYINVTVVEAATGKTVGTIKRVIFDHNGLMAKKLSRYYVKQSSNKDRVVIIKLTLSTNIEKPQLALVDEYSDPSQATSNGVSAKSVELQDVELITNYTLEDNYPNPFNPATVITYTVPKDGMITLKVYDMLGREVSTLVNQVQSIGRYEVQFDGSRLASGVYFYRLTSGTYVSTKKMLLMK